MSKTILTYPFVKQFFAIILAIGLITGSALALVLATTARATNPIVVTTDTDGPLTEFTSSACSLRQAIHAANNGSPVDDCFGANGLDTIILPAGVYTLNAPIGSATPSNPEDGKDGDLDILEDLIILGAGADITIINGDQLDRVFDIKPGINVEISGVTVLNGHSADGGSSGNPGANGGGIRNEGALTLRSSVVKDNQAGEGAADQGGGGGGGIYNTSTLNLISVTVTANQTGNGGVFVSVPTHGGPGGGVLSSGSMTLLNSTISNNFTGNGDGPLGEGGAGGGIFNGGTLLIQNSTIVLNNTVNNGAGGGLVAGGPTTVKNTILANNTINATPNDCENASGFTSQGFNLLKIPGNCAPSLLATDITAQDPSLSPLADNGGGTLTFALQPGSVAIDGAQCGGSGLGTDQHGRYRRVPIPWITHANEASSGDGCDIGAYEAQPELDVSKSVFPLSPNRGQLITYTVRLTNSGVLSATEAVISDSLDPNLTFIGPITLDPDQAGAVKGPLPNLASNLTLSPGLLLKVTFPVSIGNEVISGTVIPNFVTVSSAEITTPVTLGTDFDDVPKVIIGPWRYYLPIVRY